MKRTDICSRVRFDARNIDDYLDYDYETFERLPARPPLKKKQQPLRRGETSESFKCKRCKSFVGAPPSGGRHRNHCPACLYSLHVDGKTPGDRSSTCRSLMEPVRTSFRPNGGQEITHRCLGCGFERYCRVAADDSPLLLMRLPLATGQMDAVTQPEATVKSQSA